MLRIKSIFDFFDNCFCFPKFVTLSMYKFFENEQNNFDKKGILFAKYLKGESMENRKRTTTTRTEMSSANGTSSNMGMSNNAQSATKSRGMSGSTFAIIALSLLLVASIILGVTGAFFTGNATVEGTITLGDPVTIGITQGGASASSLTFDGVAMPGTVYDQAISITQPASTSDSVVRAKLTLNNAGSASVNVEATTASGWTTGEDDYYYYNGVVKAGESHDFITAITVPKSLTNADANKAYSVNVVVEAIQFANGAAKEVWTTAPQAWVTSYGSGTTAA